jgi:hypothetical protein
MTACAVGEEIQLLLFDSVLHLTTLAVHVLVKFPGIARLVGHDEPGVRPLGIVLTLDDRSTLPIPSRCRVAKRAEDPLRLTSLKELPLGA